MFLLSKPSEDQIREFIKAQQRKPFSYPDIGATILKPPAGYKVDHNRARLGEGGKTFARAVEALKEWKMFDLGWVELFRLDPPDNSIRAGETLAVLIHHYGLWSLNSTRIVYVVEEDLPARRFGFAYGTLPEHGERGEERFTIEWRRDDDSVWYDLLAFSRPQHLLAKAAYPLVRRLQKRFARDSLRRMVDTVAGNLR